MIDNKWFVICLSAVLFACAFFLPAYVGWFVFIYLTPLFFYLVKHPNQLSFKEGLIWGMIFYLLHFYAIAILLLEKGQGRLAILGYPILVFYFAVHSGLWFWLAKKLTFIVQDKSTLINLMCWILVSWLYILFIHYYVFWILGRIDGYGLSSPLLPLVYYHRWLTLLPHIHLPLLTLLLCFNVALALVLVQKKIKSLLRAVVFFLPFFYGWLPSNKKNKAPAYLEKIGFVAPPDHRTQYSLDVAREITQRMQKLLRVYPEVDCIVMPESSYKFPLNEHTQTIKMWYYNVLRDNKQLLIGSHRGQGLQLYNCLYWLSGDRIKDFYDKVHLMPFTENIPYLVDFPFVQKLFFTNKVQLSHGKSGSVSFALSSSFCCVPYICSELFFSYVAPDIQLPILSVVNDSWFLASYFKNLLFLCAKFKAIRWQKDIMYVAHSRGVLITKNGETFLLKAIKNSNNKIKTT